MKDRSGFTLVELVVVIAIIGIILAMITLNFKQLNDKYTVESYTKEIYSLLMRARNDAANTNIPVSVTLADNLVTTYQDTNGNAVDDAGDRKTASPYPRFTLKSNLVLPQTILFDRRGMTDNIQTINIDHLPNISPGVDCIVVAETRINMGRIAGGACVQQ